MLKKLFIRELVENDYREIPQLKIFADVSIDYDKLYGYFMLINEQQRKKLIENLNDKKPVKSNIGMAVKLTAEHETFNYPEGATVLYHLGFLTMMSDEEKESIQNSSLNDEYLSFCQISADHGSRSSPGNRDIKQSRHDGGFQ